MDQQRKREVAEALLVLRAQLHEERAFTDLVHRYNRLLHGYLVRLVGPDNAEDVLQQTWIKAHRRLTSLEEPRAFKGWLFAIARRQGLDSLRREQRSPTESPGAKHRDEDDDRTLALLAHEPADPTAVLAVRQALERLAPKHQELLRLRFEFGLSYHELATGLGINIGTVRSRLHASKEKLRSAMKGDTK